MKGVYINFRLVSVVDLIVQIKTSVKEHYKTKPNSCTSLWSECLNIIAFSFLEYCPGVLRSDHESGVQLSLNKFVR